MDFTVTMIVAAIGWLVGWLVRDSQVTVTHRLRLQELRAEVRLLYAENQRLQQALLDRPYQDSPRELVTSGAWYEADRRIVAAHARAEPQIAPYRNWGDAGSHQSSNHSATPTQAADTAERE